MNLELSITQIEEMKEHYSVSIDTSEIKTDNWDIDSIEEYEYILESNNKTQLIEFFKQNTHLLAFQNESHGECLTEYLERQGKHLGRKYGDLNFEVEYFENWQK